MSKLLFNGFIIVFCFVIGFFNSCTKNDAPGPGSTTDTLPKINSYNPSSIKTGSIVTLTGVNFGSNLSLVNIYLGTTAIVPTSVSGNNIIFRVPANLISSGSADFDLKVVVNGKTSNVVRVTVTWIQSEQTGWYYIHKNAQGPGYPRDLYFFDDRHGFAYGNRIFTYTIDSGVSWGSAGNGIYWSGACHVFDEDEAWVENNWYDIMVYDFDPGISTYTHARLDTITTIPGLQGRPITGTQVIKKGRGYFLTFDGSLYKAKGSFKPSDINLEYRSSVYAPIPLTYENNNYYSMTGLDSNNLMIAAKPKINGNTTPMVIVKRNGVYQEYFLDYAQVGWAAHLVYADVNNLFFVSINYDLYKLNLNTNTWVKLNTPKFSDVCFINANTGYATGAWTFGVEDYHVYKTTDGGLTWNIEYSLEHFLNGYTIGKKGNKIWIVGENVAVPGKYFLLKYNP